MGRKSKVTFEQKLFAVKEYLEGRKSQGKLAEEFNIRKASIRQWISLYQAMGETGLITSSKNVHYSEKLKYTAVEDYLAGTASQIDICKKYNIRSKAQLSNWIMKYNGHEKLKSSRTGGNTIMTKGRTTTYDERITIVKYCIEHQNNYAKTAKKFQVSYQQVHSWTSKYLKYGIEALQDKRGKRKSEDEMSEVEKLRAQNKLLEAENKRKQMEIDLLKKLDEIERGRS